MSLDRSRRNGGARPRTRTSSAPSTDAAARPGRPAAEVRLPACVRSLAFVGSTMRVMTGSEKDSWVVWIDEGLVSDLQVGSGDCSVLVVTTHASWSDGSTYDCEGAIDLGG